MHNSIDEFGVLQVREFFPAAQEFFRGHPLAGYEFRRCDHRREHGSVPPLFECTV
jgi:hypothetical protein